MLNEQDDTEGRRAVVLGANRGYALKSSRTLLIRHFLSNNWDVVLATADDIESRSLFEMGAHLEPVTFSRRAISPCLDLKAYNRLSQIYRRWRPEIVHNFHAKPMIFGTLAARHVLGNGVRIVNTITGLGRAFVGAGMFARLAGFGYAAAASRSDMVIFQNRDDRQFFIDRSWVLSERATLITSSGVDVNCFAMRHRSIGDSQAPVVVMLGRLLKEKGVPEFAEVARRVQRRLPRARFLLAGELEHEHPDRITLDWLKKQKGVEYVGRLSDVRPLLEKADLLLYPSYYREGVPRVILEAAATGLPVVGFDVPGVREAVRDSQTGYLVPYRDMEKLVERVEKLLNNAVLRRRMGSTARRMVEETFDMRVIFQQYVDTYRELGMM